MCDYRPFRKDNVPWSCVVHKPYAGLVIYKVTKTQLAQDCSVNNKEFTENEWHYAI